MSRSSSSTGAMPAKRFYAWTSSVRTRRAPSTIACSFPKAEDRERYFIGIRPESFNDHRSQAYDRPAARIRSSSWITRAWPGDER